MNPINAVIYDMDGVIIDSEPLWREALIYCFNKVGFNFTQEKCRTTQGMRLVEVVEYWYAQQPWEGKSIATVEQDILTKVTQLIAEKGAAMEGVYESLEFFKNKGYQIALASSSPSSLIDVVLEKLNIKKDFEVIQSAEFLALGKPHPEVFITTAKKLNLPAINCLVIEDSLNGVLAAKAALMQVIAIPEKKYHNDPRFSIANYNLKSLNELETIIE